MPITFKSKLSSTIANQTFLDKTIDDKTIGQFGLDNPDNIAHGEPIISAQKEINSNTRKVQNELILEETNTITLSTIQANCVIKVKSLNGAIALSATPFGTIDIPDGSMLILIGQSDTDTVKISYEDNNYGCIINGNAILKKGLTLTLMYDATLIRYVELSRNF